MSKEHFETQLSVLEAMLVDESTLPNLPVDAFLKEAENLSVIAEEDKAALTGAGLDWKEYGKTWSQPDLARALRERSTGH